MFPLRHALAESTFSPTVVAGQCGTFPICPTRSRPYTSLAANRAAHAVARPACNTTNLAAHEGRS